MKFIKIGVGVATLTVLAGVPDHARADPTPECNAGPAPASTECGANAIASSDGATAVGDSAHATGATPTTLGGSTAVGAQAQATGAGAQAFGWQARATGVRSLAVGYQAQAANNLAAAVGPGAIATGLNASALGPATNAGGMGASAIGNGANASGSGSTATGVLSIASGDFSTALGRRAAATGTASLAVGNFAVASAADATAIGNAASAGFANSTALGANASTSSANQVTLGGTGTHVRIGDIAASTGAQDQASAALATIDANGVLGRDTTLLPALSGLQSASALQAGRVDTLFDLREIDRRDMRQGIAAAVAMGQASMPSEPGRTAYVLNGAVFRGEFAIGGSLLHRLDAGVPLAIGVGFSFAGNKNNALKAGVAGEF